MKNNNPDDARRGPGTNPETESREGSINPSAPTTGTEGYGTTSDEREQLGGSNPGGSSASAEGAGDVRRTSYPRNEAAENRAADVGDTRKRSQQLTDNPDARGGKVFNCSEVGPENCTWNVSGNSFDEMMPDIERHGREAHGIESFDDATRRKIRDAIRERRAA